ncbi:hypothetical protein A6J76_001240 [Aggregatibacter aphrophilus]|uniref:hypothetical protein n=1 Tax=Aggregatibacter aphrophilus TaxID=732 RepID=UPI0009F357D4|nr:hypothetical protein [Aggregatibacter aphrophilus]PNL92669.1 hypothetical protein A6J76_001240 [Aggregatibacter aphrophilus]
MKPTNPMAKLEQWKKNNEQEKINQFVNEMNQTQIGAVKNCETDRQFAKAQKANLHPDQKTQQEAQSGEKRKYQGKLSFNPLAFEYAQLSRQFKLIHDSNRKCLEVYPDDFHHKLKMREEMVNLIDRLKAGGKLFNTLAKSQGVTFCRDNQATLKDFNQANGYLIHKFEEVIAQINQLNIERVEGEKLQGVGIE